MKIMIADYLIFAFVCVIVLSYGRGLTLREIGLQVGLSESGVCRVRARALRRLRSALGEEQEAA